MLEGPETRFTADRLRAKLAYQTISHPVFILRDIEGASCCIWGRTVEHITCHGKTRYSRNQF